jgi:hypothetical protein
MAMLFQMLEDAMAGCQEEAPPQRRGQQNGRQPYYQNQNGARPGSQTGNANQMAMSEQNGSRMEWSRSQPQQGGNRPTNQGGKGAQQGGKGQGGKGQSNNAESQNRNSGAVQRQASAPSGPLGDYGQWTNQPPTHAAAQTAKWQDEMNLRDVATVQSPRGNHPAAGSRQAPKGSAGKGSAGKGSGGKGSSGKGKRPPNRDEDTIIGKGFTAAMKRGVAQAKPHPTHEEMVPQKDGGFIATIQQGFQGLFGKPTSKEEVLRKRGAVLANEYEAVPGDEIDQRVQFFARRLPEDVAGCLKIFRKSKGQYQINDEIVSMEQRFRTNPHGGVDKEIFVFWTTETGEQSDVEPLGLYLSHGANVAYEVKQGGNVITQVPDHVRMSFHEEKGTDLRDGSADARFNAMEVAARQAKMREEAAMEWRNKQSRPPVEDRREEKEEAAKEAMHQPQAAAPAPVPHVPQPQHGQMPAPGMHMPVPGMYNMPPGAQQGTFYGVQAPPPFLPRQGTMYAYGSAGAQPGVMAQGYAPMQRQGTMYAYGSGYAVPVR